MAGATTAAASSVTVNGSPANVYSDHTFALDGFTPIDGTNTFTAVATDALGRGDTNTVVVNLPAAISFAYDDNGNMTTNGTRVFEYDDENQLIRITEPNAWRSVFTYDGKMRRRERRESVWDGAHWVSNLLVRYVYDGNLVLQERQYDPRLTTTVPQRSVTYTRGRDLSGGLQGAGGIGGLLARTDSGFSAQPSVYYHCDNVGNVTALVNSNGTLVGRYWYDPFGTTIALAGAAAEANLYRFSSKEWHEKSGLVHYLYRYYAPSLQRWITRDPAEETGGANLHGFIGNNPISLCDPDGLTAAVIGAGFGSCLCPGVGTAVGAFVGVLVTAVAIAVVCKGDTVTRGECEFYRAWYHWGNNRPPKDPGKGWRRNAPCGECYASCKAGEGWDFSKCPMGGPSGPRWPKGGKWPGGRDPAWPTPGKY